MCSIAEKQPIEEYIIIVTVRLHLSGVTTWTVTHYVFGFWACPEISQESNSVQTLEMSFR